MMSYHVCILSVAFSPAGPATPPFRWGINWQAIPEAVLSLSQAEPLGGPEEAVGIG